MPKKSKLSTPAWILKGEAPPKKEKSGKKFKIRECPKCKSDEVGIVLSNSDSEEGGGDEWECRKCGWKGQDIIKKELTEDELMKYMDEKEESTDFDSSIALPKLGQHKEEEVA